MGSPSPPGAPLVELFRALLLELVELLGAVASPADRAAAVALAPVLVGQRAVEGTPEAAALLRFLARRQHLIVRGGAATLLREALSEPAGSTVRAAAEAAVEPPRSGASTASSCAERLPRIHAVRRGSTRPHDDGLVRTIETGGHRVGGVAFSADGASLYTFVWSCPPWLDDDSSRWGSRFQEWRADSGELVREAAVGQFREENGAFAVSPDGQTLAVRSHRDISIHALHDWPPGGRPALRHRLAGCEGSYTLTFLDDSTLVADDSSLELARWDVRAGRKLDASASVGWRGHVRSPDGRRLFLGGCGRRRHRLVGVHRLPSLALAGFFAEVLDTSSSSLAVSVAGVRCETIDISPAGRWLVTGDDGGGLTLWPVAELEDPEGKSAPAQPRYVPTRALGRHAHEISAVRFVDEHRLLSADLTGLVLDWRFDEHGRSLGRPRALARHVSWVNGLAIHPRGHLAATSSEDGRVLLWDLLGEGTCPPPPLHPMRRERRLVPHPEGVEILTDGTSQVFARPPARPAVGPIAPQDPELRGVNVAELSIVPVDEPGPPQLHVLRGEELVEVIELEAHCGGLCALDDRTFALADGDAEGHVSFWELQPALGPLPLGPLRG